MNQNLPNNRRRGEAHPRSKLTESDVVSIRKELATGRRGVIVQLAQQYQVSTRTIANIRAGKAWTHVVA